MATYEQLLADQSIQRADADEGPEALGKPALTAAQQRMRYLKIGGAAVAGGALLAVTGASEAGLLWPQSWSSLHAEGALPGSMSMPVAVHTQRCVLRPAKLDACCRALP